MCSTQDHMVELQAWVQAVKGKGHTLELGELAMESCRNVLDWLPRCLDTIASQHLTSRHPTLMISCPSSLHEHGWSADDGWPTPGWKQCAVYTLMNNSAACTAGVTSRLFCIPMQVATACCTNDVEGHVRHSASFESACSIHGGLSVHPHARASSLNRTDAVP